jgi:GntR family transcriptional repressor for pyruvate dehydrogenase complex
MSPDAEASQNGPARGTLHDVRQQVAERIHRGVWRFGDRLPAERTLAAELGVSRTTVRRACRDLVAFGVLEVRSGAGSLSGTFVRSELVPRGMLGYPTSLPLGEITGVLESRRLFEPEVALLAAERATRDDLTELRRTITIQEKHVDDPHQVSLLDPSFHIAMARATHNETIVAMMEVLHQRLVLLRTTDFRPTIAVGAIEQHRITLDALISGDRDKILAAMDSHLGLMEGDWRVQAARSSGGQTAT